MSNSEIPALEFQNSGSPKFQDWIFGKYEVLKLKSIGGNFGTSVVQCVFLSRSQFPLVHLVACCSSNMPFGPFQALREGFSARVEVLKTSSDEDRRLVVTHAENYSARDVISNRDILCIMMKHPLHQFLGAKKDWIAAFQSLDNVHGMRLSRTQNVKCQLSWAKVEHENVFWHFELL